MDTIFAQATAPGRAGVAVLRVSGPEARKSFTALTGQPVPPPRVMRLFRLRGPREDILDHCPAVFFEGPASFTGEDVVEYHLHGSQAIVSAVLSELGAMRGHRMAEPGEFTRRALSTGQMDLTQVEGLADLIEAQTELQRRQAQQIVSGAFTQFVEAVRSDLIRAAALLEVSMDFADEEVPEDVSEDVLALLLSVSRRLKEQIAGFRFSERVRSGFEVAIVGVPNAGKSTLLNALSGRDAAIVSQHAGTTRDVIEVQMDLEGVPVTILDTAGLRSTDDEVEGLGIARAKARADAADLRVVLLDQSGYPDITLQPGDIEVWGKADVSRQGSLNVSGKTGEGLDLLVGMIKDRLAEKVSLSGLATRERHVAEFRMALGYIESAQHSVEQGQMFFDIAAEDLRSARHALAKVLGHIDVENVLDVIFSSFCLGK